MARTRDQFTGHIWLQRLGCDRSDGRAPVWDMDTIANNTDWLISKGYLCLSKKPGNRFTLQIFPTDAVLPSSNGRFAACYEADDLRAAFQAAVNDYMHALCRDTSVGCVTGRAVRWVQMMKGEAS